MAVTTKTAGGKSEKSGPGPRLEIGNFKYESAVSPSWQWLLMQLATDRGLYPNTRMSFYTNFERSNIFYTGLISWVRFAISSQQVSNTVVL